MLKTNQSWNDNHKPRGSNFLIRLIETSESRETDLIYVLTGGGLPPVYLQAGIRRKPTRECVCGALKGTRCLVEKIWIMGGNAIVGLIYTPLSMPCTEYSRGV